LSGLQFLPTPTVFCAGRFLLALGFRGWPMVCPWRCPESDRWVLPDRCPQVLHDYRHPDCLLRVSAQLLHFFRHALL